MSFVKVQKRIIKSTFEAMKGQGKSRINKEKLTQTLQINGYPKSEIDYVYSVILKEEQEISYTKFEKIILLLRKRRMELMKKINYVLININQNTVIGTSFIELRRIINDEGEIKNKDYEECSIVFSSLWSNAVLSLFDIQHKALDYNKLEDSNRFGFKINPDSSIFYIKNRG